MYKIIGADGQEYGPVTAEQLRQWIAENRANAQTRARTADGADWKPLGQFPEFAHWFANPPPLSGPPLLAPQVQPASPDAAEQVELPAITLMAFAVMCFLLGAFSLVAHLIGMGFGSVVEQWPPELDPLRPVLTGPAGLAKAIFDMILSAVIFFAAHKMKRLENYALAIIGTVLSLLPCVSPCCCLGLPIGIWILVVLSKPEVKAAFH